MFDFDKSKIITELNGGEMHLVIPISNNDLLDIPPYSYTEHDKVNYRKVQVDKHLKRLKIELENKNY